MKRRWLIAAACLLTCSACGKKADTAAAPHAQPTVVTATPVLLKQLPRQIEAVGTASSNQSVAVVARIASQITGVGFKDGDTVKAGQMLFQLDGRAIQAQLGQAQATLAGDQAQVPSLQKQVERTTLGLKKGFFSQADVDTATAALNTRKAAVLADQAAGQNLQVQLSYTVITAPIDGRAGNINATLGNSVAANSATPLVTINQIEPLQVNAALPQSAFDSLKRAAQAGNVKVIAARNDSAVRSEGVLSFIDNTIDVTTGTFTVHAMFPNKDETLWPGMLVTLTIDLGKPEPSLIVPTVAVQQDEKGNNFTYVVAGGKAKKTNVKVDRTQDDNTIIAEGLQQGEQVVIDGMMSLKDGSTVTMGHGGKAAPNAAASPVP